MKTKLRALWHIMADIRKSWPIYFFSTLSCAVAMTLWYFFHDDFFWAFGISKEVTEKSGSIQEVFAIGPGTIFGALEGWILFRIMNQYTSLRSAMKLVDARAFLALRDERTHSTVHQLMVIIYFIMMWSTAMLCTVENYILVMWVMGAWTFLYTFMFLVGIELNNPFTGKWRIEKKDLHKGWLTMTILDIYNKRVPNIIIGDNINTCTEGINEDLIK